MRQKPLALSAVLSDLVLRPGDARGLARDRFIAMGRLPCVGQDGVGNMRDDVQAVGRQRQPLRVSSGAGNRPAPPNALHPWVAQGVPGHKARPPPANASH